MSADNEGFGWSIKEIVFAVGLITSIIVPNVTSTDLPAELPQLTERIIKLETQVSSIEPLLRKIETNYQDMDKEIHSQKIILVEISSTLKNMKFIREWEMRRINAKEIEESK